MQKILYTSLLIICALSAPQFLHKNQKTLSANSQETGTLTVTDVGVMYLVDEVEEDDWEEEVNGTNETEEWNDEEYGDDWEEEVNGTNETDTEEWDDEEYYEDKDEESYEEDWEEEVNGTNHDIEHMDPIQVRMDYFEMRLNNLEDRMNRGDVGHRDDDHHGFVDCEDRCRQGECLSRCEGCGPDGEGQECDWDWCQDECMDCAWCWCERGYDDVCMMLDDMHHDDDEGMPEWLAPCEDACVDNNESGESCYEACMSCGDSDYDCPEWCVNECDDCLCCVCEQAPEEEQDTKDAFCGLAFVVNSYVTDGECLVAADWADMGFEEELTGACDDKCLHNNVADIDCYTECDACLTGLGECPQDCQDDCWDCLDCFCENYPNQDAQDFVCNFVGSVSVGDDEQHGGEVCEERCLDGACEEFCKGCVTGEGYCDEEFCNEGYCDDCVVCHCEEGDNEACAFVTMLGAQRTTQREGGNGGEGPREGGDVCEERCLDGACEESCKGCVTGEGRCDEYFCNEGYCDDCVVCHCEEGDNEACAFVTMLDAQRTTQREGGNGGEGPREGGNGGEGPREGENGGEGPREGENGGEGPREDGNGGEGPREGGNDGEGPREDGNGGEGPREDGNE